MIDDVLDRFALCQDRSGGVDLGDVLGGGFPFPAEKRDVAQHGRLGADGDPGHHRPLDLGGR